MSYASTAATSARGGVTLIGLAQSLRAVARFLGIWVAPVLDLAIRLWIARVFFVSGLTKIADWQSTLFLFEYEYQVPILPVTAAAVLGTAFELVMPVLLVLGLFARLAALPLLAMSLVIQFVLGAANPAYDSVEHFYWMFLLLMIILRGPGPLSIDHLIGRWIDRQTAGR